MIQTKSLLTFLALVTLSVPAAYAQSDAAAKEREAQLKRYFEGKAVVVKIDMPGTSDGVEIVSDSGGNLKADDYRRRLSRYPAAIRAGQSATITKVKLKDKLIEFHLDGGGYGSDVNVSDYVSPTAKSEREKNLEKDLKQTTDDRQRREIKEQIDDLKRRREYLDTIKQREARERAADEHERRMAESLRGGSRFNISFPKGTPVETFTPEWIMTALARYVEFGGAGESDPTARDTADLPENLRKGLTRDQVDDLLGKPRRVQSGQEGRLATITCTYFAGRQVVEALYVEGVLVRYSVSSR